MSRAGPESATASALAATEAIWENDQLHSSTDIHRGDLVIDRLTGDYLVVGTIDGDTALLYRQRQRGTITIPLADLVLARWDTARRVLAALPPNVRDLFATDDDAALAELRLVVDLVLEAIGGPSGGAP